MKKIIYIILILLFSANLVSAFDGQVYGGKYFNQDYSNSPNGGNASYISGLEIGHIITKGVRPYIMVETLSDGTTDTGFFHPTSIKYDVGLELNKGYFFTKLSHMCWHPVDTGGNIEEYNLIIMGFKFK